jgi:hypothetical protein
MEEWADRRKDLYLTKHNSRNLLTSMLQSALQPTIAVSKLQQTDALNRVTTAIGMWRVWRSFNT